jgi:hypothetical protein
VPPSSRMAAPKVWTKASPNRIRKPGMAVLGGVDNVVEELGVGVRHGTEFQRRMGSVGPPGLRAFVCDPPDPGLADSAGATVRRPYRALPRVHFQPSTAPAGAVP